MFEFVSFGTVGRVFKSCVYACICLMSEIKSAKCVNICIQREERRKF